MFCENCGLQFLPQESVCSRCGTPPTRHWLQLVSLATLTIAVVCNSLIALYLLPSLVAKQESPSVFRTWLWFSERLSLYGWLVAAVALLAWAYWPRQGYEPEKEVRVARVLLISLLLLTVAVMALPWIPLQAAKTLGSSLEAYPGLSSSLAWAIVVLAAGILCLNRETRDRLLGTGRALSLVGLGLLLVVAILIFLSWQAL